MVDASVDASASVRTPAALPTDRPRPRVTAFFRDRVDVVCVACNPLLSSAFCTRAQVEPLALFLGAVSALVGRYVEQDRVCIGTALPIGGEITVALPVEVSLAGDLEAEEIVARAQSAIVAALRAPPSQPVGVQPAFRLFIACLDQRPAPGARTVTTRDLAAVEKDTMACDLALVVSGYPEEVRLTCDYDSDLFEPSTVHLFLMQLEMMVVGIITLPDRPVAAVPLMTRTERERLLEQGRGAAHSYSRETCIHRLFERQVERSPERVAVVCPEGTLTYGELNARANRLAHDLQSLGVERETRVALYVERGLAMIVAVWGILKAGGCYVPLDTSNPVARLRFLLEDSGASVLVTQERLVGSLPVISDPLRVMCLDTERVQGLADVRNPESDVQPGNLAYIVYTSGSTGTPKGVAVQHRNLVNSTCARFSFYREPVREYLHLSALSFDSSAAGIFWTLCQGGRLRMLAPGVEKDSVQVARCILLDQPSHLLTTPAFYSRILADLNCAADHALATAIVAGEPCPQNLVEEHYRQFPRTDLFNEYGPTEATVWASVYSCAAGVPLRTDPVSIGGPIANIRLYVLDSQLEPVPVGIPGELFIAGEGPARGYWGRPGLTAERFIPDPFPYEFGARMYRSGDRARWMPDGTLQFLTRADRQVKIRGVRVEPGEIEVVLRAHASVRECVVVAREDALAVTRLVAYVTPAQFPLDTDMLRRHALERLPDSMVPSLFIVLQALPLTPHGKVDRGALPSFGPERLATARAYLAPRSLHEKVLADICADLLQLDRVGINDNFFSLGGDSLLAGLMLGRLYEQLGVELPLAAVFEQPTVAGLVATISTSSPSSTRLNHFRMARRTSGAATLSHGQERLWFLAQMQPGSAFYNVALSVHLTGRLDSAILKRALDEIVRRHKVLRTSFPSRGGKPLGVVSPPSGMMLPIDDLSALPDADQETDFRSGLRYWSRAPFDLNAGPLMRARLFRLSEQRHVLLLVFHHIVTDGWSSQVLVGELAALYQAAATGMTAALPAMPAQYADFVEWQKERLSGDRMDRQLAHWRDRLSGALNLDLPSDLPRPAVPSYRGATYRFTLSEDLVGQLKQLGRDEGATLFVVLFCAYKVLLARYSGQEDIVVGTAVANRPQGFEGVVGFFVNTLAVRSQVTAAMTVRDLIHGVRKEIADGLAHEALPFESLVEALRIGRDLSRNPLFQTMFVLQGDLPSEIELPGLRLKVAEVETGTSKFDLTLQLIDAKGAIFAGIEYSTDLFAPVTVARMGDHYRVLLEGMVSNPNGQLASLPMLTKGELATLLLEFSRSRAVKSPLRCLHEVVAEWAVRTPNAEAVICGAERLTYAELDRASNCLAHYLRERGVGLEVRVGLLLGRSLDLVVAILATLKAGGGYVPLDPSFPDARLATMCADAEIRVVVACGNSAPFITHPLSGTATAPVLVDLVRDGPEVRCRPGSTPPMVRVTPENLAYVIYTSGSTGTPKGTMVPHRAVPGYQDAYLDLPHGTRGPETWLQYSSLSWDALTLEMWTPLLRGARCVLYPPEEEGVSPEGLGRIIVQEKVTTLWITASVFNRIVDTAPDLLASLSILMVGGEALSTHHVRRAKELFPSLRLVNGYGPSECTVFATCQVVNAVSEGARIPIGSPVGDRNCYVLDSQQQPVAIGIVGELCIGGPAVARGYLGRPALTADVYVPDAFGGESGTRLYRTGDRARWRVDGVLEFMGRLDHQVKVRGFRIEPGEIESLLLTHPTVGAAAVLVRPDLRGEQRLVAYVAAPSDSDSRPDVAALRGWLGERFPAPMVPSTFVVLDRLPMTSTGKVDRPALPCPQYQDVAEYAGPRNVTEEFLVRIWTELLTVRQIGIHDSFFDLGGHSLLATQVVSRVRRRFGTELPLPSLFERPTVAQLAEIIDTMRWVAQGTPGPGGSGDDDDQEVL